VDELSQGAFEQLVADALDLLPDELAALVDNVAVFVEDEHPDDPDLLGLYEGQPLTERGEYGGLVMPDRITIYRLAICDMCDTEEEVVEEVAVIVVHEVAHHFGIDDRRLHELGWG
jgi:predicted Zn-dependent protease with MMP-like domain